MQPAIDAAQIKLARLTPAYWRVTFDNPPLNLMGPPFVLQFKEIVSAIETDEQVKVVVFDSAVEGFFLNHSDFLAKLEDLTGIPPGPTDTCISSVARPAAQARIKALMAQGLHQPGDVENRMGYYIGQPK